MILEAHISYQQSLVSEQILDEICKHILSVYEKITLPALQELNDIMIHDKKNVGSTINFSLINNLGSCLYDQQVDEKSIIEAIKYYENIK